MAFAAPVYPSDHMRPAHTPRAVSRMDFFLRSAHEQALIETKTPGATERYLDTGMAIKSNPEKAMMVDPKPDNWARRRLLWRQSGGEEVHGGAVRFLH